MGKEYNCCYAIVKAKTMPKCSTDKGFAQFFVVSIPG